MPEVDDWERNEYEGIGIKECDDAEAAALFRAFDQKQQQEEMDYEEFKAAAAAAVEEEAVATAAEEEVARQALQGATQQAAEHLPNLLRKLLKARWERVISIFKAWDEDGNGSVDRAEFARGLEVLGIVATADEVKAFFAQFDPDNSGALDFRELSSALRKHRDSIRPGDGVGVTAGALNATGLLRTSIMDQVRSCHLTHSLSCHSQPTADIDASASAGAEPPYTLT